MNLGRKPAPIYRVVMASTAKEYKLIFTAE